MEDLPSIFAPKVLSLKRKVERSWRLRSNRRNEKEIHSQEYCYCPKYLELVLLVSDCTTCSCSVACSLKMTFSKVSVSCMRSMLLTYLICGSLVVAREARVVRPGSVDRL